MRKLTSIVLIVLFLLPGTMNSGEVAFAQNTTDLYCFDANHLYFDFGSLSNVSSSSSADLRFQTSGSDWLLKPVNEASIQDLGNVNYDNAAIPSSGYSVERVPIVEGHVYAVRSNLDVYGLLKITYYDQQSGNAGFMAKAGQPDVKLNLYYLSGDYIRFDLNGMKNVSSSSESDLYFRYSKTEIHGENGASIKDLGAVDYNSVKAPLAGYTTDDVKLQKDHVYAVKIKSEVFVIKVTNVINESNMEFLARTTQFTTEDEVQTVQEDAGTNDDSTINDTTESSDNTEDTDESTPTDSDNSDENQQADKADLKELYWVESGVRFILSDKILFEDEKGINEPCLSPNKKYVLYSNGSTDLYIYNIAEKTIKKIYSYNNVKYGVHPVGWSQDNKEVAFIAAHRGGYIGSNKLYILNLSTKKVSVVAKGLSSADWGRNGKFVIADGKKVWLVDEQGRNKTVLKVPTAAAFSGADYVSFNYSADKVIYTVASKYYIHDIKKDEYTELSIPKEAASNGAVSMGKSKKIAVVQDKKIYIYDPSDKDYGLLYDGADSAYPNWVD